MLLQGSFKIRYHTVCYCDLLEPAQRTPCQCPLPGALPLAFTLPVSVLLELAALGHTSVLGPPSC